MNEEMKIIIKAVTDSAKKEIGKVKKELDGLGKGAKSSGGKASAAMKGIATGAAAAVAAVVAVGAAIVALGKNTLQLQKEQARLTAAFEAAGSTAKQAAESYNGLYRFLGDSGKASEAAAHLAKLTTNQKDLAEWTKISQGIYATFGDSLPIEGLTEAANETVRVGKVTGTLADALNWAGISEDAFNARLATTNSLSEREAMLRSTLNDIYKEAAEIYERNNKALLDYNESQARLDTTMAAAGRATLPLLTALNNLGAAFFTALKPALDAIIPPIATFINWIAKAIQSVMSFFSALTGEKSTIKAVGADVSGAAAGANKFASGMGAAEKAAEGAAKAAEEAKKSTQGFDELNIVPSGSGSSGGAGGGSGGGASTPGYATGIPGVTEFSTEIEESDGKASKLAEKVKKVFAEIGKAFEPSVKAWSGAWDTIKESWNNAKPDYINGLNEVKKTFTNLGGYIVKDFVPSIVNSFSTNLAPVIGDVFGFVIEEVGKLFSWLAETVNITVDDMIIPALERVKSNSADVFKIIGDNWKEHGESLMSALSDFGESLRGTMDNIYNNILLPIWNKILAVWDRVWTNGLKPLIDEIVDAVMVIATEITIFYNEVLAPIINWIITNVVPPIVKVVNTIIDIVGSIIIAITKIIKGIIEVIKGVIQFIVGVFTGNWEKAWTGIKNIFIGIWDIIKGVFTGIWDILSGIATLIVDVVAAAFKIAWEAIKKAWSGVVQFFKNIWEGIKLAFSAVGNWFADIFKKAWDGIKTAWGGVKQWFSDIWSGIKQGFENGIGKMFTKKFWSDKFDTIKQGGKDALNGLIGIVEKAVNWIIKQLNKLSWKVPDWVPAIGGKQWGFNIKTISIPRLAEGGIVTNSILANIGERGKEAVLPLENNTGWMDMLADRIAARNNNPTKLVLKVGEKELGWATIGAINGITEQTGGLQLVL